ncbi:MAG: hypothetical protein H6760_04245 [Candidatus Nomurabacteria bacterium]|nr:MAG: hypothetical protein H6760_04245 [Candidatus Nomurabacteria bacterium]
MSHIVILDQDPIRQLWYQSALPGHVISFVETALGAIRLVQQVPTAAIIAEYFDGSGTRLLEELDRLVRNCRFAAPPVYLTGTITMLDNTMEKAVQLAQNRGAQDFIPHPISRERFRERLADVLEQDRGGRVVGHITFCEAPPVTTSELVDLTYEIPEARDLINATIGMRTFSSMLNRALAVEGHGPAQIVCAEIGVWATEGIPTLTAAEFSAELGDKERTACQDILFEIAHSLLFDRAA